MAKILANSNGDIVEVATVQTSSGAPSADKIPSLDSGGKLHTSMMPAGIAADTISILASEAIAAGDFVNIYNNAGTSNIRKADATNPAKRADAYVLAAVSSGQLGDVYFDETNNALTGQTPGIVFLSDTTPGKTTTTAPTGSGKIVQKLGIATSATTIHANIQQSITLA